MGSFQRGLAGSHLGRMDAVIQCDDRLSAREQRVRLGLREPARIVEAQVVGADRFEPREVLGARDRDEQERAPLRGPTNDLHAEAVRGGVQSLEVTHGLVPVGENAVLAQSLAQELRRRRCECEGQDQGEPHGSLS